MKNWLLALAYKTFIRGLCHAQFLKRWIAWEHGLGAVPGKLLPVVVNSASCRFREVILHRNARELQEQSGHGRV